MAHVLIRVSNARIIDSHHPPVCRMLSQYNIHAAQWGVREALHLRLWRGECGIAEFDDVVPSLVVEPNAVPAPAAGKRVSAMNV
jgi:hypothetical protein